MTLLSWLVLVGSLCPLRASDLIPLHIGGTFPMEGASGGWAGGPACLPAVQMALEDVNRRRDVLPGYVLHMKTSNSKCQPGLATQQLYEFLYTPPTKIMLLSGCSPVTTVIAESAPVWKLVVLSYGASSPALSNRDRFPTLFRTHPSANMQNPTRIKLFQKFKWKKVTILQSVEEVFTSTAKDLEEQCRQAGIRVERQSFYGDPTDSIKTLVRQDSRIIVGLYYVTEARRVLCQAYKHGVYGRKYVWFLIGWYADTWYIPPPDEHLNCTAEEMSKAAMHHFTTESIMLSRDENPAVSGMTGAEFQMRLNEVLETDPAETGGYPEAPLAYDAVWALALALNCTNNHLPKGVKLEQFSYDDNIIYPILFECVKNTHFRGVSGRVMFSDSGDRIARTQIEQLQSSMKYKVVGYYDTTTQSLDWQGGEEWPGKGAPPDSTIIKESIMTVANEIYYAASLLSLLGIGCSVFIFVFVRRYSGRAVIMQSQAQCNNVMVTGCILSCVSLFFMGLPSEHIPLPKAGFSFFCHIRISLLMFGFTLGYGSMFAKVWIVHRMGASENQQLANRQKDEYKPLLSTYSEKDDGSPWENIRSLISTMVGRPSTIRKGSSRHSYGSLLAKRNLILNQPIKASRFYWITAALFAIDVLIICVWVTFDPLQRKELRSELQDPPAGTIEDIKLLPVLELCQSNHQEIWTGLILGYKSLLLVFGFFIAYESRNLRLRYVNDSRKIILAIYNVVVLAIVTGPIATLLIRDQANANFIFVSGTVLICSYMSLGLIFIPKIQHVYTVPPSADELQTNGNGLTRGLSRDDQKRYDQLKSENDHIQTQIDEREKRIRQCKERLEKLWNRNNPNEIPSLTITTNSSSKANTQSVSGSNVAEDTPTHTNPTTLTTTALIELQPANEFTGRYKEIQPDHSSSSSDEILL